jgi:hypothetical protein
MFLESEWFYHSFLIRHYFRRNIWNTRIHCIENSPVCNYYPEDYVWFMVFNATFKNVSVISWGSVLKMEEIGAPGEIQRPAASHWQTLSHNFKEQQLVNKEIFTVNIFVNTSSEKHSLCKCSPSITKDIKYNDKNK